jgi:hypothetical protein
MNAVLPFAEQMLATHAEFIPFGGATRPDGEIVSIAGYDGSEHPKSVEIIALMKERSSQLPKRANIKRRRSYTTYELYCLRRKKNPMPLLSH